MISHRELWTDELWDCELRTDGTESIGLCLGRRTKVGRTFNMDLWEERRRTSVWETRNLIQKESSGYTSTWSPYSHTKLFWLFEIQSRGQIGLSQYLGGGIIFAVTAFKILLNVENLNPKGNAAKNVVKIWNPNGRAAKNFVECWKLKPEERGRQRFCWMLKIEARRERQPKMLLQIETRKEGQPRTL